MQMVCVCEKIHTQIYNLYTNTHAHTHKSILLPFEYPFS